MFEFDSSESVYPSSNVRPFNMSSLIFLFACTSFSIFGDFSFDFIDFNADTILERLFHLKFWCLAFGFWWSFFHCCYHLVVFFFFFDICDLVSLLIYFFLFCWNLLLLFQILLRCKLGFPHFFQFSDISFSPY